MTDARPEPAMCAGPHLDVRKPKLKLPAKAADCHCHVFGPRDKYPWAANWLYTPPPVTLDNYLAMLPATGFEPGRVGMADKELRFWSDIDGKKPLRALLQTTPIPVSQTYRIVFALCRLGVLALGGGPTQRAKEEPADVFRRRL